MSRKDKFLFKHFSLICRFFSIKFGSHFKIMKKMPGISKSVVQQLYKEACSLLRVNDVTKIFRVIRLNYPLERDNGLLLNTKVLSLLLGGSRGWDTAQCLDLCKKTMTTKASSTEVLDLLRQINGPQGICDIRRKVHKKNIMEKSGTFCL